MLTPKEVYRSIKSAHIKSTDLISNFGMHVKLKLSKRSIHDIYGKQHRGTQKILPPYELTFTGIAYLYNAFAAKFCTKKSKA